MADTLNTIISSIGGVVFGDPNTANISATDYSVLTSYVNKALGEYENAYDWQHLYGEYNVLVSTASNNASIALPQDFKKPASRPFVAGKEYNIVRPQESGQYLDTDNRVSFYGNPRDKYTLVIFGDPLASGASIKIPYYRSAGSLATVSDIAPIPDTTFLSQRGIALWYEAHEDARFLTAKLEAERILGNLIDYENVFPEGSTDDHAKTNEERTHFRLGED